ncbi:DNA polymerase III subunit delta [Candidatus Gracilibacteria bacterium]|nr:DNA polymerase III subunit delta [Candidatus Gracilibacteria bacterium]
MLFLLYGPDEFMRSEVLHALKAQLPPDLADLNTSTLDGRKLKLDALATACEAMPFLVDKRIVVVSDALKHTKAGKERDELIAYLLRVPAGCDLIFVENDDVDKRGALFNQLKKIAEVREFLPREGADLMRWLNERAKQLGVKLEPAAAQRLIDYVGPASRGLINELNKLASYVGRGGRITAAEVDLLVQDDQEQNLFTFIDELSAKRGGAALRSVRQLLDDGQAAPYVLFMVARQVRILLGVRGLAERRIKPDAIAAELGQKPFVVRKALDQVRNFGSGELEGLHDRLLALDHAIKTGRIQSEVALELFVAEATLRGEFRSQDSEVCAGATRLKQEALCDTQSRSSTPLYPDHGNAGRG